MTRTEDRKIPILLALLTKTSKAKNWLLGVLDNAHCCTQVTSHFFAECMRQDKDFRRQPIMKYLVPLSTFRPNVNWNASHVQIQGEKHMYMMYLVISSLRPNRFYPLNNVLKYARFSDVCFLLLFFFFCTSEWLDSMEGKVEHSHWCIFSWFIIFVEEGYW